MNSQKPVRNSKTALIIFGISGDLSKRKLLPALFRLYLEGELKKDLTIFGLSRQAIDKADLQKSLEPIAKDLPYVGLRESVVNSFMALVQTVRMDSAKSEEYAQLNKCLDNGGYKTRLFYLSIPPLIALPVIKAMHESCISQKGNPRHRLMLEKPFGFDLESARDFVQKVDAWFDEDQVFRIDHYMAKETARNIAHFRFRNPIMTEVWTGKLLESITIFAHESIGIEGRVQFYEQTGALRDVLQSHLLSLAALVSMDKPQSSDAEEIQSARYKALKRLKLASNNIEKTYVRAQYASYRKEVNRPKSAVETFVRVNAVISHGPLKGVPVHLETGKALYEKRTEIRLAFKSSSDIKNFVTFEIQPKEAVHITLDAKKPGLSKGSSPFTLTYTYQSQTSGRPDGYESVLLDAFNGDRTNFITNKELLETWRIVDPIIKHWELSNSEIRKYEQATNAVQLGTV